jgi:hypothetical protein
MIPAFAGLADCYAPSLDNAALVDAAAKFNLPLTQKAFDSWNLGIRNASRLMLRHDRRSPSFPPVWAGLYTKALVTSAAVITRLKPTIRFKRFSPDSTEASLVSKPATSSDAAIALPSGTPARRKAA